MTQIVILSEAKNLGSTNWMLSRFFGQSPQQLVFLSFGRLNDKKRIELKGRYGQKQEKMHFFENFLSKYLQIQKKAVPLHRF